MGCKKGKDKKTKKKGKQMGEILTSAFGTVLSDIILAVMGVVIAGLSTLLTFLIKRFNDNIKKSSLKSEIDRYVDLAEKTRSFSQITIEEKTQAIVEKARQFAEENDIKVSDRELTYLVENSLGALLSLEHIGEGIMKLNHTNSIKGED